MRCEHRRVSFHRTADGCLRRGLQTDAGGGSFARLGPAIVPPLIDHLEARPDLVERKVTVDVGAGVELSTVNEMLAQRLTVLPPESFAANAIVYLKFFSKNPTLQKAAATLVQARIGSAALNVRAISSALSQPRSFEGQIEKPVKSPFG